MTSIKFTSPTTEFPFFHNVSIKTKQGWRGVKETPDDGRTPGPALFPTKEEMVSRITKLVRGL